MLVDGFTCASFGISNTLYITIMCHSCLADNVSKIAQNDTRLQMLTLKNAAITFSWTLRDAVTRTKSMQVNNERCSAVKRLFLTCAMHSGPWLPLVLSCSESALCPGSGQGERSEEVRAACRWSSGSSHQSVGKSQKQSVAYAVQKGNVTYIQMKGGTLKTTNPFSGV